MIDLHSHILPGIDDGARTLEETLALARSLVSEGVNVVAATPHVRHDFPTRAEVMERTLAKVRDAIAAEGIALDVRPGGEIALDYLVGLDDGERARFGLGGNPGVLLVEFPYFGWPLALPQLVWDLRCREVLPVIAHPERNAAVQSSPGQLEPIVECGALVQLTAASVDGRLGKRAATCARRLLDLGLAHLVASDAHAPAVREAGLRSAAEAVGDERLADWLLREVPGALLVGDEMPPRPARKRRRRWR